MKQSVKAIVISAAVLGVLVIALIAVLLTAPKEEPVESLDSDYSDIFAALGWEDEEQQTVPITSYSSERVLLLTVTNQNGSYTVNRGERGGYSYWTADALGEVTPDQSAIGYFVSNLAMLSGEIAEQSADDLEKYGLKAPLASAAVSLEDGTELTLNFGIRNPARKDYVYCSVNSGSAVMMVEYAAVEWAFSDVKALALLTLTEAYDPETTGEPEYIKIERADFPEPVEIRYMSERTAYEDLVITTLNTHRLVSPLSLEIDASAGSGLCYGVCGLTASSCEFLEQSEENMRLCGLDSPRVKVTFRYNGQERTLLFGNETDGGYYAVLEGTAGIFSIAKDKAPWADFELSGVVTKRPLSPYIYGCESVEIITRYREFRFEIEGEDAFTLDGASVGANAFKELYSQLVGSVGEELFTEQTDGAAVLTVRFNYTDEYRGLYGTPSDELSFLAFDGRKYVVNINGKSLFKVGGIYVSRILDSVASFAE